MRQYRIYITEQAEDSCLNYKMQRKIAMRFLLLITILETIQIIQLHGQNELVKTRILLKNQRSAGYISFIMLLTYISGTAIYDIEMQTISKADMGGVNGFEIKEGLRPNVGTAFYTVLPQHGYGIGQEVKAMTKSEVA